jgi:hypothetical protein
MHQSHRLFLKLKEGERQDEIPDVLVRSDCEKHCGKLVRLFGTFQVDWLQSGKKWTAAKLMLHDGTTVIRSFKADRRELGGL